MKTALVTGGAGFVGTNLIKRLLSEGYKVVSIDNYSTGFVSNQQKGAVYYEYDIESITDFNPFSRTGTFDVVYHLAAIARIQPSFNQPLEYFQANATATFNIAMYCAKNNIPLQFAGSSSHHSGKFQNPYTFSKDVSEEIVMLCQQLYGLKATITRFYNVYGPHHLKEGGYCTVIGKWEKAIELGLPITIYGDGSQTRTFCYITDAITGFLKVLVETEKPDVYNVGNPEPELDMATLAKLFSEISKSNEGFELVKYPSSYPEDEPNRRCPNIKKISTELGYTPKVDLNDGLARFISWSQANYTDELTS